MNVSPETSDVRLSEESPDRVPTSYPGWLSQHARSELARLFPHLVPTSSWRGLFENVANFVSPVILSALTFFAVTAGINESLVRSGLTLGTYSLTSQDTADFLSTGLEYLAALVGIVIPVTLLVVEFTSRNASAIVDVYLDEIGIRRTAVSALFILGIEASTLWLVRTSLLSGSRLLFYSTYGIAVINMALLIETGRMIWRLRRSFSTEFLVSALSKALIRSIRASQRVEIHRKILERLHERWCTVLGVSYAPFTMPATMAGAAALRASRSGLIVDIQLPRFVAWAQSATRVASESSDGVRLMKPVGTVVSTGEVLAYVPDIAEAQVVQLTGMLEASMRLGTSVEAAIETGRLLKELKGLADAAIREENDDLLQDLLKVYGRVLQFAIEPPPRGVESPVSRIWPQYTWGFMEEVIRHFRDLIESASRCKNESLIASIAYLVAEAAGLIITHARESGRGVLGDILGLFVAMYVHSSKSNNTLGVHRSYFYLHNYVIDHHWLRRLEGAPMDPENVDYLTDTLGTVLHTFKALIRQILDAGDTKTLEAVLPHLQREEMFAYASVIATIQVHEVQLLHARSRADENERLSLDRGLAAVGKLRQALEGVDLFFDELILVSLGYVIELNNEGKFDDATLKRTWNICTRYTRSIERTLDVVIELAQRRIDAWHIFHRFPDTKQAIVYDDSRKLYWSYCLIGIVKLVDAELETAAAKQNESLLRLLEETLGRITSAGVKWASILDLDEAEVHRRASVFLDMNKRIAANWQLARNREIADATISPAKMNAFSEAVHNAWSEEPSLHRVLEQHGVLRTESNLAGKTRTLGRPAIVPKEPFTDLVIDSSYVSMVGLMLARGITADEDDLIIDAWVQQARAIPTRKQWKSLDEYMKRALDALGKKGHQPTLIILPMIFGISLTNLPEFTPPNVGDRALFPRFQGYYRGIPVIAFPRAPKTPYILAVDINQAVRVAVTGPYIDVPKSPELAPNGGFTDSPTEKDWQTLLQLQVRIQEDIQTVLEKRDAIAALKLKLQNDDTKLFGQDG